MKRRKPTSTEGTVGSLLMAGALGRVLGALAIIGMLWLAVRWAATGAPP